VSAIETEKSMVRKSGDKNVSLLNDVIVREREKILAEVDKYRRQKEAEANKVFLYQIFLLQEILTGARFMQWPMSVYKFLIN
jgi:hypothetical protein